MGHLKVEGGDGNGFPGGLRLSWPAIAATVAVLGLASRGIDLVRDLDRAEIDGRIKLVEQSIAAEASARSTADQSITRGLERIEGKLDQILEHERRER